MKSKSQKKINSEKQWLFFYLILQNKGKESEVSYKPLYGDLNSCWFHHILPKSKYPELRYCPDNIIMLTPEEHEEVEKGKIYDEVENRKESIIFNYKEKVEETNKYIKEYLDPMYEHAKTTKFFKQNQHNG